MELKALYCRYIKKKKKGVPSLSRCATKGRDKASLFDGMRMGPYKQGGGSVCVCFYALCGTSAGHGAAVRDV